MHRDIEADKFSTSAANTTAHEKSIIEDAENGKKDESKRKKVVVVGLGMVGIAFM